MHIKKLGYFKTVERALQKDIIPQSTQHALQFFLSIFSTPTYLT